MSRQFLALHQPGSPVIVANVWDAATASWACQAGFSAVGTSSLAVAESVGFSDHEQAPPEIMMEASARIAKAASVPVTVDVESGYGLTPDVLVQQLVDIGAAGFNIEDTDHLTGRLVPARDQARYIARLREALDHHEDPPVLNARVDPFLRSFLAGDNVAEEQLLPDVVERANLYLSAGADCVFPIRATNRATIRELVHDVAGSVNTLALPTGPTISTMAEDGVARVSFGPRHWWGFKEWFTGQITADCN